MIPSFSFAKIPFIHFGAGKLNELYKILPKYGNNILLVTGKSSFQKSSKFNDFRSNIESNNLNLFHYTVSGEPSPEVVSQAVSEYKNTDISVVLSIGGGSVLDSGKAISAMMLYDESIENFLEGVGTKIHDGRKIPFIGVPTTAGTGSEVTKNAVISRIGPDGYKKSLRHDNLIPNHAIIDPELMTSCPPSLTGACGMDAFSQLLESFVSTNASPMTDALARSGLKLMIENLIPAATDKSNDVDVRGAVAYATLISGITLANAGLGTIHGFASAVGGNFDIPHGVVCGTLMSEGNRITIELLENSPQTSQTKLFLRKYAEVGAMMAHEILTNENDIPKYCKILVRELNEMTKTLGLKKFGEYGIKEEDLDSIISKGGNKNNPVALSKENMREMLINRL